jgi:hypothetical protein
MSWCFVRTDSDPLLKNSLACPDLYCLIQIIQIIQNIKIIKIIKMALLPRPLCAVFRKDYKHMANPLLNSYLVNDSINNSQVIDPTLEADTLANDTVDAYDDILTNPTLNNAKTFDYANANNLLNLQDNSKFDNSLQSVNPFDLALQTLSA